MQAFHKTVIDGRVDDQSEPLFTCDVVDEEASSPLSSNKRSRAQNRAIIHPYTPRQGLIIDFLCTACEGEGSGVKHMMLPCVCEPTSMTMHERACMSVRQSIIANSCSFLAAAGNASLGFALDILASLVGRSYNQGFLLLHLKLGL